MFLHHMELVNGDIGFITNTCFNNKIDLDSMISQTKQARYTIILYGCTNRKLGGLMCVHKSGLNVH